MNTVVQFNPTDTHSSWIYSNNSLQYCRDWQTFTKYTQSINIVSKVSALAKHVLKFTAENFMNLTESVFKSNLTEFVADRLGMREPWTQCCQLFVKRLFMNLLVNVPLIMIYEVKLFHLQHQTRISFKIMRGIVYLNIIHNKIHIPLQTSKIWFELMLFIDWLLWIIRCPRVQYLHKWFSPSQKTNTRPPPGGEKHRV